MLRRPEGATVDEVVRATGWQRHTVRGVFLVRQFEEILNIGPQFASKVASASFADSMLASSGSHHDHRHVHRLAVIDFAEPHQHREHYEIAKRFGVGRTFTRLEFNHLYRQECRIRISTPNPADYCINLHSKAAEGYPKFLRWLDRGRYEFIGEQV